MAIHFDAATSQYLSLGSALVSTGPFSVSFWTNLDQLASAYGDEFTAFWIGEAGTNQDWFMIRSDDGNDALEIRSAENGASRVATTTADVVANTWQHWGASENTTSRTAYLSGGNKGTESTEVTVDNVDDTFIGANNITTIHDFFDGSIAEFGVWNVTLTDAEYLVLAAGYSPLFVRPQSLVAYWPLIRDYRCRISAANNLTAHNTPTIVAHPKIIYPAPIHFNYGEAAAPPVGNPGIMTPNTGYWGPTF